MTGAAMLVALTAWLLVCMCRLTSVHESFQSTLREAPQTYYRDQQDEMKAFFGKSRLMWWRSLRPLLRQPWRHDVHLNWEYNYGPGINRYPPDAYAIRQNDGTWRLKIHW